MIRKPIITVLGHVDAGKTRVLDSIRGSAIAEREAGGITQHIGATEVPLAVIQKIGGEVIQKYGFKINIPGLLFIDTPGHEAFTKLRKRGGSIADLAVLVVDVTRGCQPQTYEAIEILKSYKTAFIVAANKCDSIRGWQTKKGSVTSNLKNQHPNVLAELDKKVYELVGQLYEKGFTSERFDRIKDFTKEIAIIPTCAKFGEGTPEVLCFLAALSQKYLEKKLNIEVSGSGKGTVLEVKEEKGLGTTLDVILYDGTIRVGEEIVVGGRDGIIKSKIRALLEPRPLDEMRDPKEKFKSVKQLSAAAGVKISAPGLDSALAGSPVRIGKHENPEKEVLDEIEQVRIESDTIGAVVRADALGSLEALVKLLTDHGIKVRKADVGEVTRRDIMEVESVKQSDPLKGVVFAFHTKMNEAAIQEAENLGVKVFQNNVVYKLIEDYEKWIEEMKNAERRKKLSSVIMPAKFEILINNIFRNSKPAIVGVKILGGKLRTDTDVMKDGVVVGTVEAIQSRGKSVQEAKEGDEVAISISGAIVGRTIEEKDILYSSIPDRDFLELKKLESELNPSDLDVLDEIKKMKLTAKAKNS